MRSLLRIRAGDPPGLTESGIFRSVNPLDVPLWLDARNVVFRDGGPQKVGGWVAVVEPQPGSGAIRGMDALQDEAGIQRLFWGDAERLWMWNTFAVAELGTGFQGQRDETVTRRATAWSFVRYGNWMLASNGVDPVQIWRGGQGSGLFEPLPGTTFSRAEILLKRGPHVLAFNTSNGGHWIEWCSDDNPTEWQSTTENSAGDLPIRDMDGEIIAAVNVGENIAVFGKNQMFVVQYSAAPYYFTYQPALTGIGAVGKMAVVEANRRLYGMSRTGVWETDGVTYRYLDTLALSAHLDAVLDRAQLSKVVASYDATHELVRFSIPSVYGGENDRTLTYRIPNQSWSLEDHGRTAAVPHLGVFRRPMMAGPDGRVYVHNEGTDAGGEPLEAWVRTKPLDLGDPRAHKVVQELNLQVRRLAGRARARLGGSDDLDGAIYWGPWREVEAGFERIDTDASGRFVHLEVGSVEAGADWALSGFDLHGQVSGVGV